MKQIFLLILSFQSCILIHAQSPTPASGSIKRFENFKSQFVKPRNVDIWLPGDYSSTKKYAVLYMHDGQMLFDSTTTWNKQEWGVDETVGYLLKTKKIKECIVVGIWNTNIRHSEYFPQKPFESLSKNYRDSLLAYAKRNPETSLFSAPVQSDQYLKFLVTELKPFIDSAFSTKPDQKNTFIAGSSMGGLISIYALCEYPDVFGGAACLSTHWPGIFTVENNPIPIAVQEYLKATLPNPKTHRIYFDYGTETLDALYEPLQLKVDEVMKQKHYTRTTWVTKKFTRADHSEKAWRERLEIPITFLLSK
jgi:predicted alpha/beta superfamily hydrolase